MNAPLVRWKMNIPVATRLLVRRLTEDSERVLKCQTQLRNWKYFRGRSGAQICENGSVDWDELPLLIGPGKVVPLLERCSIDGDTPTTSTTLPPFLLRILE